MVIEKREFPRADIICKISTVYAERLLVFNTHTENVAQGGIRVILDQKLNIPTPVDLDLFLSESQKPMRCKGEVVWAKELKPDGVHPRLFDTGIKFTEMSEQNKEAINQLVNSLVSEDLNSH
ncbi:MAG: PilZ domain-containing protein [Candidatus Omnitrophota bacterium]